MKDKDHVETTNRHGETKHPATSRPSMEQFGIVDENGDVIGWLQPDGQGGVEVEHESGQSVRVDEDGLHAGSVSVGRVGLEGSNRVESVELLDSLDTSGAPLSWNPSLSVYDYYVIEGVVENSSGSVDSAYLTLDDDQADYDYTDNDGTETTGASRIRLLTLPNNRVSPLQLALSSRTLQGGAHLPTVTARASGNEWAVSAEMNTSVTAMNSFSVETDVNFTAKLSVKGVNID